MSTPATAERRPDLDWIRVGAFFLLILYHVGMFYVPWDFHVKSPKPVEWLQPVMMLSNPWRLTLLFVVSGAATRFIADKATAGALAKARTARLLPPLIFAMFVIVPPQSYYEIVEQIGYSGSVAEFYGKYVTASGNWCDADGCLITPTYNHLWFVAYLFIYSLLLAGLLAVARPGLERLSAWTERALDGWGVLVWPVVFLAAIRILLHPVFPITHALVDDWYNHALSFSAFLLGFLTAKSEVLKAAFIRARWPALAIALTSYATYVGVAIAYGGDGKGWVYVNGGTSPALEALGRAIYAADQWCAIAAILGFGAKHLTRGGPVLSYLTLGVFPFYIIHQTTIVVAGHHLAKLGLNQALEAAILIALTFASCFLTYEIVRRVNWLRPLFGLKPLERAPRGAQPAAA